MNIGQNLHEVEDAKTPTRWRLGSNKRGASQATVGERSRGYSITRPLSTREREGTLRPKADALGAVDTIEAMLDAGMFKDTGCEHAPACLSCPLPQCLHDTTHQGQNKKAESRREAILEVYRTEPLLTLLDIAARFHVSKRTVGRVVAEAANSPRVA